METNGLSSWNTDGSLLRRNNTRCARVMKNHTSSMKAALDFRVSPGVRLCGPLLSRVVVAPTRHPLPILQGIYFERKMSYPLMWTNTTAPQKHCSISNVTLIFLLFWVKIIFELYFLFAPSLEAPVFLLESNSTLHPPPPSPTHTPSFVWNPWSISYEMFTKMTFEKTVNKESCA